MSRTCIVASSDAEGLEARLSRMDLISCRVSNTPIASLDDALDKLARHGAVLGVVDRASRGDA